MEHDPSRQDSSPEDVHAHLQGIAELLRQPHRLDTQAQAALADLVEELDQALKHGSLPAEEAGHLAATASQFAEAVHRGEHAGPLESARDRLLEAAVAAENRAPLAAGLARRIMEALSNIGI